MKKRILIIGAGMAGTEAAYFLANKNYEILIAESKKKNPNKAQSLETCAELVCTNSLKSLKVDSAHGLLKYDMEKLGSLVLKVGMEDGIKVPAGDALAVDRVQFSRRIEGILKTHPNIVFIDEEVTDPRAFATKHNCEYVIIATGPLTLATLENWIQENIVIDKKDLYFYDAIAPIVDADTLNYDVLYYKDRHKDVDSTIKADYLNAPFTKEEYLNFVNALKEAIIVPAKDFEKEIFFENCLPIDVLARRGVDSLRYSCMKPIGLEDPRTNRYPYAAVQLRKENLAGDAYNIVGFQNRLTYGEQKRIFKMIPGFENAEFFHFGSVHRNTYINAKNILSFDLSCQKDPTIYFAGQIVGVEGYTESAMCGLYVAYQLHQKILGNTIEKWPIEIATGALINHIMTATTPRPTNVNFGLMPAPQLIPKGVDKRKFKREIIINNAKEAWKKYE